MTLKMAWISNTIKKKKMNVEVENEKVWFHHVFRLKRSNDKYFNNIFRSDCRMIKIILRHALKPILLI